jgi:RNA polymerase sigma factor (sigma-70 family)
MVDDATLLRRYVADRSEAAFRALVERHIDFVFSVARREVRGDFARAQDVTQEVFTALAQKATLLQHRASLAGWLHVSAHHAAAALKRSEQHRQRREQEAHAMHETSDPAAATRDWTQLEPLLNALVQDLGATDREAVLLRFYRRNTHREVAAALHLTEEAAQKRVERALEKMRRALVRRGLTSTPVALAALLEANAVTAAPAGLAGAIVSAGCVASGGAAAAGATILMSSKSTLAVSVVALTAIGSALFQWQHARRIEADLAALTLDRESLRSQDQQRTARYARDIAALQGEIEALKVTQVAQPTAPAPAADTRSPTASDQPQRASPLSPDEKRVLSLASAAKAATEAYHAAHHGQEPPNPEALIPYFATPQEGADWVELIDAPKGAEKI